MLIDGAQNAPAVKSVQKLEADYLETLRVLQMFCCMYLLFDRANIRIQWHFSGEPLKPGEKRAKSRSWAQKGGQISQNFKGQYINWVQFVKGIHLYSQIREKNNWNLALFHFYGP